MSPLLVQVRGFICKIVFSFGDDLNQSVISHYRRQYMPYQWFDSHYLARFRQFVAPDEGFDLVDMGGEVRLWGAHADSPELEVRVVCVIVCTGGA